MLIWPKRPRKETWKATGEHLVLVSKCKLYRVSRALEYDLPTLACWYDGEAWQLLSRHRKPATARAACERHAAEQIRTTARRKRKR